MHVDDLTPVITQEECAEVIQAISKVFRFGLEQKHPWTGISNKESLEEEIGQLMYMLLKITNHYDLNRANIWNAYENKQKALDEYEQYFPF